MKLILKEEVDKLGLAGDVVDVADGYGRNFLIPKGFAIRATTGALKEAELLTRSRKAREAKTVDSARQMAQILESRTLRIPVRVDDHGHLYGSVGVSEVHKVLRDRGHQIERRRIDLRGAIKQIGDYVVPVSVHPQVTAEVKIEIVDVEGKVGVGGLVEDTEESLEDRALAAAAEIEGEVLEEGAEVEAAAEGAAIAAAEDDASDAVIADAADAASEPEVEEAPAAE